jgi:hypothetical protein
MQTRQGRRLLKGTLRRCRYLGHDLGPRLGSGVLYLYGCYTCRKTVSIWDNPANAGGECMERPCTERLEQSWLLRMRYKIYLFITEGT